MSEPSTAKPFAIDLIIKHHGSVEAVVADGDLRDAIRDHLGYQPREEFIDDKDGQRWTWFDGERSNPYIQTEIDVAIVALKSRLEGGPQEAMLTDIAARWTRYHEAFHEAVRSGQDLVIDTDGNLALQTARYDYD